MRGTKKDIQQLFFQVAVIYEVLLNMKTHWTNSEPSCWLYLPVSETTKWPGVIQLEQPAPLWYLWRIANKGFLVFLHQVDE